MVRWSARNASTFTGSRTASPTWSVLPLTFRRICIPLTHVLSMGSCWRNTRSASRWSRAALERLANSGFLFVVLNFLCTLHRNLPMSHISFAYKLTRGACRCMLALSFFARLCSVDRARLTDAVEAFAAFRPDCRLFRFVRPAGWSVRLHASLLPVGLRRELPQPALAARVPTTQLPRRLAGPSPSRYLSRFVAASVVSALISNE